MPSQDPESIGCWREGRGGCTRTWHLLQLAFWGWPAFVKHPCSFWMWGVLWLNLVVACLPISTNGYLLPSERKASIQFHRGWSPNTCWRTEGRLNFFPLPSGESCCAFNAFPRLRLYFLNTSKLCAAPLPVNSKLNSGGVRVAQGMLLPFWSCWKGCLASWTTVAEWCCGCLSWVTLLKYKVSFGTHQVVVLIAVVGGIFATAPS